MYLLIDIVIMNEINVKMNAEQIALLNKLLSPYVELYQSINIAFQKSQIISSHPTDEEINEITQRS